jgi:hypothetical protein
LKVELTQREAGVGAALGRGVAGSVGQGKALGELQSSVEHAWTSPGWAADRKVARGVGKCEYSAGMLLDTALEQKATQTKPEAAEAGAGKATRTGGRPAATLR